MTCGLPYANGPMHVGHLRSYVPGDIFVRFLRKLGQPTLFICGSDTHGTPITVRAEELGLTPQEVVEKYHQHYLQLYPKLGIDFTNYGNTDHPLNHNRTRQIAQTLVDNGYKYKKYVTLPYCPECQRFLPDRYLEGTCPHCGSKARGDECDQGCKRYLEPGELLDPHCTICGTRAEQKETLQYFLKLTVFSDFLEEFLEKLDGTTVAVNYAKQWLKGGLQDWNITRNIEWGIKFPGNEDLVLYVWFDAPIGYIQSTEEWALRTGGDWEYYWKGTGKLVHFIGGDIVYHHCLFWPAMLKGAGYSLPDVIIASGMVKVEGHIFSKSRGYIIWIEEDYLEKGLDSDPLRYYIASFTGHTRDLDFSWSTFQEKNNSELVGSLGNFIYRSLLFAYRNYKEIPTGEVEEEVRKEVVKTITQIRVGLDNYEFKKICDAIIALSDFGNRYIQSHEPWKLDKQEAQNIIHNALWLTKALGVLMEPVMPFTATEVIRQLGILNENTSIEEALSPLPSGLELLKPEPVFKQIPEEKIKTLQDILTKRIEEAES